MKLMGFSSHNLLILCDFYVKNTVNQPIFEKYIKYIGQIDQKNLEKSLKCRLCSFSITYFE